MTALVISRLCRHHWRALAVGLVAAAVMAGVVALVVAGGLGWPVSAHAAGEEAAPKTPAAPFGFTWGVELARFDPEDYQVLQRKGPVILVAVPTAPKTPEKTFRFHLLFSAQAGLQQIIWLGAPSPQWTNEESREKFLLFYGKLFERKRDALIKTYGLPQENQGRYNAFWPESNVSLVLDEAGSRFFLAIMYPGPAWEQVEDEIEAALNP